MDRYWWVAHCKLIYFITNETFFFTTKIQSIQCFCLVIYKFSLKFRGKNVLIRGEHGFYRPNQTECLFFFFHSVSDNGSGENFASKIQWHFTKRSRTSSKQCMKFECLSFFFIILPFRWKCFPSTIHIIDLHLNPKNSTNWTMALFIR